MLGRVVLTCCPAFPTVPCLLRELQPACLPTAVVRIPCLHPVRVAARAHGARRVAQCSIKRQGCSTHAPARADEYMVHMCLGTAPRTPTPPPRPPSPVVRRYLLSVKAPPPTFLPPTPPTLSARQPPDHLGSSNHPAGPAPSTAQRVPPPPMVLRGTQPTGAPLLQRPSTLLSMQVLVLLHKDKPDTCGSAAAPHHHQCLFGSVRSSIPEATPPSFNLSAPTQAPTSPGARLANTTAAAAGGSGAIPLGGAARQAAARHPRHTHQKRQRQQAAGGARPWCVYVRARQDPPLGGWPTAQMYNRTPHYAQALRLARGRGLLLLLLLPTPAAAAACMHYTASGNSVL